MEVILFMCFSIGILTFANNWKKQDLDIYRIAKASSNAKEETPMEIMSVEEFKSTFLEGGIKVQ